MPTPDHRNQRRIDVAAIRDSAHPRKIVVAGPGTGKSHLFAELIRAKRAQGKTLFLAITFIGKLCDALADDLCGLADTLTMHGFARRFVLDECGAGWAYYPHIYDVIKEDLKAEGVTSFEIGDANYKKKTSHYKAIGDADVVHYAIQICKRTAAKIPRFDLVLVDEYQDCNVTESAFVDELAKVNEVVVVGDDDQALYEFKGSSPAFIRQKYDASNTQWESHTLRYCSRCTEVILRAFHAIVDQHNLRDASEPDVGKRRVDKEYLCYSPAHEHDSKIYESHANPKIHLIKGCPVGMIPLKIKLALKELCGRQKIKDVLVIGEPQSCKALLRRIARTLTGYGFRYVTDTEDKLVDVDYTILDAYKLIAEDADSRLGWRLLGTCTDDDRTQHRKRVKTLTKVLEGKPVAESSKEKLVERLEKGAKPADDIKREVVLRDVRRYRKSLSRPLANLEVTVCNTISAKGLGADVVFVVGFDQGRLPKDAVPTSGEIYQMLVALTRAKKRVYLINTVGKAVSSFADCLASEDLKVEEIRA